jgi:hypothetical protein
MHASPTIWEARPVPALSFSYRGGVRPCSEYKTQCGRCAELSSGVATIRCPETRVSRCPLLTVSERCDERLQPWRRNTNLGRLKEDVEEQSCCLEGLRIQTRAQGRGMRCAQQLTGRPIRIDGNSSFFMLSLCWQYTRRRICRALHALSLCGPRLLRVRSPRRMHRVCLS